MSEYKGVGKRPEELVAGDSVLVINMEYGKKRERIATIERVTKGGKFRVDGLLYEIGKSKATGWGGCSTVVWPLKQADVRRFEIIALVRKCKAAVAAANLTLEQAKAIMRILEGNDADG